MITDSKTEKVTFQRKFKRFYQRSLLWLIAKFAPIKAIENPVDTPKNILIFVQEKMGDAILMTPLIKNLKSVFPDILIHLVIFHKQSNIFNDDPNISQVHNFKKDKLSVARTLKKLEFDVLYNTKDHPSFTFVILSRYLNAKYKVSIDHIFHRKHYHHLLSADSMDHTIEKICAVFSIWNISKDKLQLQPYMPPMPVSDEVLEFTENLADQTYIGINLSAGSPEKEWPVDKWNELVNQSNKQFIVFAVGENLPAKVALEADHENILKSPETKNINEAAAIVQKLKMLVTPSTGLMHVASCFDIPVVGLYRQDLADHLRFAPYCRYYEKVIADNHEVSNLSVIEVNTAIDSLSKIHGN
ncbi:MAG: glycosyltransferase family 9 protein [Cyclobacteriaceae bacterium]|nr:glycosyltransferase family 9 protein [Cyclobacteriaceae bacterium]